MVKIIFEEMIMKVIALVATVGLAGVSIFFGYLVIRVCIILLK